MGTVRRTREHLLLPGLVILAAVAGVVWTVRYEAGVGAQRVDYEDRAFATLQALAGAQHALHERRGRYGWVQDLEREGLLGALAREGSGSTLRVLSPRYRIDVLLPHGLTPGELIRISPREGGYDNPDLERSYFAIVARPWGEELTGFRTFYVDETRNVFVSEGVSDIDSRTKCPLPDLHVTHSHLESVAGLRWYRLDQLPPR